MNDINLDDREIHVAIAKGGGLYPSPYLFPDVDLYPRESNIIFLDNNIVSGSVSLSEIIVDNEIILGQLYANKFELTLYDVQEDLAGYDIIAYQIEEGVQKPIFLGRIDSCKKDKTGFDRQLVAYDSAYIYSNVNVGEWWADFWTNRDSATVLQLRESLFNHMRIMYHTVELPNDSLTVHKNIDVTYISFASMLKMICEVNCCFPNFDRNGILDFICLDDTQTPVVINDLYEGLESSFEDYATEYIDTIQFLDSGGEVKYQYGQGNNIYAFGKDNALLYDKGTADLEIIAQNMLDYISTISYVPSEVKMICGNLNYKLGQRVIADGNEFYIFQNEFSGPQLVEETMICTGAQNLSTEGRPINTDSMILNDRISRVTVEVEEFEVDYEAFKTDTSGEITSMSSKLAINEQKIEAEVSRASIAEGNLSSSITLTDNKISAEVNRATEAEGNLSSSITITDEKISSEVLRATEAEGNISSQITQTVNGISLQVTNGTSSSVIAIKSGSTVLSSQTIQFSGVVTFTDLSTAGSTSINGANIQTGTITANSIGAGTITASVSMTSASITTDWYNNGRLILQGNTLTGQYNSSSPTDAGSIRVGTASGKALVELTDPNNSSYVRVFGSGSSSGVHINSYDDMTIEAPHGYIDIHPSGTLSLRGNKVNITSSNDDMNLKAEGDLYLEPEGDLYLNPHGILKIRKSSSAFENGYSGSIKYQTQSPGGGEAWANLKFIKGIFVGST